MPSTKRGPRPRRLPVIAGTILLVALAVPGSGAGQAPGAPALQQELGRRAGELAEALRAAGRPAPASRAEAEALSRRLAVPGFQRLDDGALRELLAMRIALVQQADEPLCARLGEPRPARDLLPAVVFYLPDAQQRRWAEIVMTAALAEVRGQPSRRPRPPEAAVLAATERLFRNASAEDGLFLLDALRGRLPSADSDRCLATRLYHRQLTRIPLADALLLFRADLYD